MRRGLFVLLVALTFAGELAWSVAMGWPHGGWAQAWPRDVKPGDAKSGDAKGGGDDDVHALNTALSWGRRDTTLDAIIVSAVWRAPCAPGRGGDC